MVSPAVIAKAAATLLTNKNARKGVGIVLLAIFLPLILIVVLLFAIASAAVGHNINAAQVCFQNDPLPDSIPAEYRVFIDEMRGCFAELDEAMADIESSIEDGGSLDPIRVKAVFYALYFGGEPPLTSQFVHCFATSEIRTRTVTETDDEGNEIEVDHIYTVSIPIEDLDTVYAKIAASLGREITEEEKTNADNVYNLIKYGYPVTAGSSIFEGADVPYIGVDGFCSPVGANWRNIVTSEFGGRIDPISGQRDGHTGMDLGVSTGTPVRAALDGTVTLSKYYGSYGNCVMIDHGNGLTTLYGHNSQLLVIVGQTVKAGDVISLSGATGRVTGPHLHFEVRVNGERTNPRYDLP